MQLILRPNIDQRIPIPRWRHLKQTREEGGTKEKLFGPSLSILHGYDSKRSHMTKVGDLKGCAYKSTKSNHVKYRNSKKKN
jgi:hypothetical protein